MYELTSCSIIVRFISNEYYKEMFADQFPAVRGETCPMFKTLSKIGFFRTVQDEAAFRQILCTSSSHMMRFREGTENAEAIVLSTKAIRSINRRIADPVLGISDGVIVTILTFACHSVSHL